MRAWKEFLVAANRPVLEVEVCRFGFHGDASIVRFSDGWTGTPTGNSTFAYVQNGEDPRTYERVLTFRVRSSDHGLLLWDLLKHGSSAVLSKTASGRLRWWMDQFAVVRDPHEFDSSGYREVVYQVSTEEPYEGQSVVPDEDQALFDLLGEASPPLWPIERLFEWATDRTGTVLFDQGVTLR